MNMTMVGWKRQAETNAVLSFAQAVAFLASQAEQDAELQRLSRKAKLIASKVALDEMVDIEKHKTICVDRLQDCAECKARGAQTCQSAGCIYTSIPFQAKAIEKHYGIEMLESIRQRLEAYAEQHTKEGA